MRFTLTAKVLVGYLLVFVFVVVLGVAGTLSLSSAQDAFGRVSRSLELRDTVASVERFINRIHSRYLISLTRGEEERPDLVDTFANSLRGSLDVLASSGDARLQQTAVEIRGAFNEYTVSADALFSTRESLFEQALFVTENHFSRLILEIDELRSSLAEDEFQAREEFRNLLGASVLRVLVLMGVAVLVVAVLSALSRRLISRPIRHVLSGVEDIVRGEGDLTRRVSVRTRDEIGDLSRSVNVFIARLHDIISRLKSVAAGSATVSEELASSAEEISSTLEEMQAVISQVSRRADTLSDGAASVDEAVSGIRDAISTIANRIEDQSSAVSESSAAIQEMIASIGAMSSTTASRRSLIVSLRSGAEQGSDAMADAIDAMNEISSGADVIRELIQVINDVAAQTNLLAMNAAIEAAHAGDAGRGFAVVAAEIRKLAETTSTNAKSISSNVTNIIERIRAARDLNQRAGGSMEEMTKGIETFADGMSEIISGMEEMNTGTGEITTALQGLVSVTNDVSDLAAGINRRIDGIGGSVTNMRNATKENSLALAEARVGIAEMNRTMAHVAQLGADTKRSVGYIEREADRFRVLDTSQLLAGDGTPLITWNEDVKTIPRRPDDVEGCPEDESDHWYNMECAGWLSEKLPQPVSPADGAEGKRVVVLFPARHPYFEAFQRGAAKTADLFAMKIEAEFADWTVETQLAQAREVVRRKADLVVMVPADAVGATRVARLLYDAEVPTVGSNMMPEEDAFPYLLSWTGPDDWAQHRLLARHFAELCGHTGDYAIVQHVPGSSIFYSRTYAPLTELKSIAPAMTCLAMGTANLERETAKRLVGGWLDRFGAALKGLIVCDDSATSRGVADALAEAARTDVVVVASGNSAEGMQLVKEGALQAITYQSAEGDGALAVRVAAEYFNGLTVEPIRYLPQRLITRDEVDKYLPAQW